MWLFRTPEYFYFSHAKCCNYLCISFQQSKLDNFCTKIYFFDCYAHLVAFKLQRGICSKIEIFQVQGRKNITFESLDIVFHKHIFLLGTKILKLEKQQRTALWHLVKIHFWNRHVASNYYLTSMHLRSRPLKNYLFKSPNVSINCPGINVILRVCECEFVYVWERVCVFIFL